MQEADYTTQEAAAMLGVSTETIKRWARAGKLGAARWRSRSKRLGWLIPRTVVDRIVAEDRGDEQAQVPG